MTARERPVSADMEERNRLEARDDFTRQPDEHRGGPGWWPSRDDREDELL
jgi:hypothetical protein